jgi:hypothetical protein
MTLGDTSGIEADPEAETRYRQRVEALLPPERLAQFDRVQDARYQSLQQLRERFGLDEAVVDQAYGLLSQAKPVFVHSEAYENGRLVRPGLSPSGEPKVKLDEVWLSPDVAARLQQGQPCPER